MKNITRHGRLNRLVLPRIGSNLAACSNITRGGNVEHNEAVPTTHLLSQCYVDVLQSFNLFGASPVYDSRGHDR